MADAKLREIVVIARRAKPDEAIQCQSTVSHELRHNFASAMALLLLLTTACTLQKAREVDSVGDDSLAEVAITTLEKTELFEVLVFGGTLSPVIKQTLYPSVAGMVKAVFVNDGLRVSKNDKLLSISPDSLGLKYQDHIITAPFSGTILEIPVKIGERVEKTTELLTIADLSSYKAKVFASLDDLSHLKVGQSVDVTIAPGRKKEVTLKGSVNHVAVAPDKKSKAFPITISIICTQELPCSQLHPSSVVTVTAFKDKHWGYKLPTKYLRKNHKQVIILKEDNTVAWVDVKLGKFYGEHVEILELDPTARIVSSFSRQLKEGEKVKIVSK